MYTLTFGGYYQKKHQKSLLLSKFNCKRPTDVPAVTNVTIMAEIPNDDYTPAGFFLSVLFGTWPQTFQLKQYRIKGSRATRDELRIFANLYKHSDPLMLVYSRLMTEFINFLPRGTRLKDLTEVGRTGNPYKKYFDISAVVEGYTLMIIALREELPVLASYSEGWDVKVICTFNTSSPTEQLSLLRTFGLPFFNKVRVAKKLLN
jgi:hypothetical protein